MGVKNERDLPMIIDIADMSVIYLSYTEPQKEQFWLKIKNMCPWAKRVDGITGSDAAHKAAAAASETERFILIDGDSMPHDDFFSLQLDFSTVPKYYQTAQFRWKAKNIINGLCYGNGGISCWTKSYVFEMKTHEATDKNDLKHKVDFCLDSADNQYLSMHDCYSVTYPNYSEEQAFNAGFREGVKMCLVNGIKPSIADFRTAIAFKNLRNLSLWHNIGADVDFGNAAIDGARIGTYKTMLTDWDYTLVHSFDEIKEIWHQTKKINRFNSNYLIDIARSLTCTLGLPILTISHDESIFFKNMYEHAGNLGPLVKENITTW